MDNMSKLIALVISILTIRQMNVSHRKTKLEIKKLELEIKKLKEGK